MKATARVKDYTRAIHDIYIYTYYKGYAKGRNRDHPASKILGVFTPGVSKITFTNLKTAKRKTKSPNDSHVYQLRVISRRIMATSNEIKPQVDIIYVQMQLGQCGKLQMKTGKQVEASVSSHASGNAHPV